MKSASFVLLTLCLCLVSADENCQVPPVWIFVIPEDIADILPIAPDAFFLVDDGTVPSLLSDPDSVAVAELAIPDRVTSLPLIWCTNEEQGLNYSMSLTSLDHDIMLDPLIIGIPTQGVLTTQPYRFVVQFQCLKFDRDPVRVDWLLNTSSNGEDFCSIAIYFANYCGSLESFPLENLENDSRVGYTNASVPFKETTSMPSPSPPMKFPTRLPLIPVLPAVLVPSLLILFVAVLLFTIWVLWYCRQRKRVVQEFELEAVSSAYQKVHGSWYHVQRGPHEKEFPFASLNIVREIGQGAFGTVHEGFANGILNEGEPTHVAIKQLKPSSEAGPGMVDEFFREVDFMSKLSHPKVVALLGVCSLEEPFSMIFEYMDIGDLQKFLRDAAGLGSELDNTEEILLNMGDQLHIAQQVAEGMVYISSQKLVHRDLATRNCLVSTGLVIKIADFGMSREVYTSDYYRVKESAILPVRWMPPESIKYGKFNTATDVWSFGVLVWEIFTFGQQPYAGLSNEEVVQDVMKGGHPETLKNCLANHLMQKCWEQNWRRRPSFAEIKDILNALLLTVNASY